MERTRCRVCEWSVLVVNATVLGMTHGDVARVAEVGPVGTELWRILGSEHGEAFKGSPQERVERVAEYLDAGLG